MPDTLDRCQALVDRLTAMRVSPLTLLVVPGLAWTDSQLDVLRDWQRSGLRLAGHGWLHRADRIATLYHRVHSLILSRRAAEHLSLDGDAIFELITSCHAWFGAHDLQAPELYVPPAWGLGRLTDEQLAALPFTYIEVLNGVLHRRGDRVELPLTGYEADTRLRALVLAPWNRWNASRARHGGRPLRIGIHPFDAELKLHGQMDTQLRACTAYIDYPRVFAAQGGPNDR